MAQAFQLVSRSVCMYLILHGVLRNSFHSSCLAKDTKAENTHLLKVCVFTLCEVSGFNPVIWHLGMKRLTLVSLGVANLQTSFIHRGVRI